MKIVLVILLFLIIFFAGFIFTGSVDKFIEKYCSPLPESKDLSQYFRRKNINSPGSDEDTEHLQKKTTKIIDFHRHSHGTKSA